MVRVEKARGMRQSALLGVSVALLLVGLVYVALWQIRQSQDRNPLASNDIEEVDAPVSPLGSEAIAESVAALAQLPVRVVGQEEQLTTAQVTFRYLKETTVLSEEVVTVTGDYSHQILFADSPSDYLVVTATGSSDVFVLTPTEYDNLQQTVRKGRMIPLPMATFNLTGAEAPSVQEAVAEHASQQTVEVSAQPIEDNRNEKVVVMPALTNTPSLSIELGVIDPDLTSDVSGENPFTTLSGSIIPLSSADKERILRQGESLAVKVTNVAAGEIVEVMIDSRTVTKEQVLAGDGAMILVDVPDDLPGGRHNLSLKRIDGTLATEIFTTTTSPWPGPSWDLVAAILAILVGLTGLVRTRVIRWPHSVALILLGAMITYPMWLSPVLALVPVMYQQKPGEVYIGPGAVSITDPASELYHNPIYLRYKGTSTSRMWGTIGLVTFMQRFAGEWARRHPGSPGHPKSMVVFNDCGLKGGGLFPDTIDDGINQPDHAGEGHTEARACDFWSVDLTNDPRTNGLSHIINDSEHWAADTAQYSHEQVAETAALLRALSGNQVKILFKPQGVNGKTASQVATELGIDYRDDHGDHWHIEVPADFQGPPPEKIQ